MEKLATEKAACLAWLILRQPCQTKDEFIELPDEQRLEPPMRLTLVILGLCPADAQEDGAFLAACRAGDATFRSPFKRCFQYHSIDSYQHG